MFMGHGTRRCSTVCKFFHFVKAKDVKNSLFPLLNWKIGIIISAFPVHSIVMYSLC